MKSNWNNLENRVHNILIKEPDYSPYFKINKSGDWQFLKPKQLEGSTIVGLMDRYGLDYVYFVLDEIQENDSNYKTKYIIKKIVKELNGI